MSARPAAIFRLSCLILAFALTACTSPAEEARQDYEKGQALLEAGELVKARLEFRNALQINDDLTGAWYGLAQIAEEQGKWKELFGALKKVVALEPDHWQAQIKLGRLLLAAGKLDEALEASNTALALQPENADALALHAAVLYKLGDHQGAVEQASASLAKDPENIDAIVVLATERLAAGDPRGGIQYLNRRLEHDEKNVALQLIKVQALEQLSDVAAAEAIFRKLITFYPENRGLRPALARFYLNHGLGIKAEAEYRAIAAENPGDRQAKLDVVRFVNSVRGAKAAVLELQAFIREDPDNTELKFALVSLYQSQGDLHAAKAILREMIENKGSDSVAGLQAKGKLAALLLMEGDRTAATRSVNEILAKDQRNGQALLLKARMAIADGDLDHAIADLRTILRDAPNSAGTLLLLGKAQALAGHAELAQQSYLRAFHASDKALPYGIAYADFLMEQGKVAGAEQVLADLLITSPGYLPALGMVAQARLLQRDWKGAQQIAGEIRRSGGQEAVSDRILGFVHAGQRNFEASIAAFKRAYQAAPAAQPMVSLVRTYVSAGRADEAMAFLDSVLQASPGNANALLLRGQLQVLKGDTEAANLSFRAAIDAEPSNVLAYRALVHLYMSEQRYEQADRVVAQGLEAAPGNFILRLSRAAVNQQWGHIDDAIRLYEELLKLRPNSNIITNNLATLLSEYRADNNSRNHAYELARRFAQSDIPQFQDTLGWAAYQIGKYTEAASLLESAAERMPNMPIFRYHLGMSYLALENWEAAERELRKSLELAKRQPFQRVEAVKTALQHLASR